MGRIAIMAGVRLTKPRVASCPPLASSQAKMSPHCSIVLISKQISS